jgi:hypothetical protein
MFQTKPQGSFGKHASYIEIRSLFSVVIAIH